MRIIEFRGKVQERELRHIPPYVKTYIKKGWAYGFYYEDLSGTSFIVLPLSGYEEPYYIKVIRKTVGQHTGIKDLKGNDVYEGDIIEWRETKIYSFSCATGSRKWDIEEAKEKAYIQRGVVKFSSGHFCLSTAPYIRIGAISSREHRYKIKTYCSEDIYIAFDFRVVGNIHDNPEFMEV